MWFSALVILALLNVVSAFPPTVTVTCTVAPSYTFTLASASATGVIFVDGQCAAQATAVSGTYTFDAAACTAGTVPALGTEFKVVVQEYSVLNLQTDYIVKVTCNLDTSSVTQVVTLDATGEDFDATDTASVTPTFSVAFEDDQGAAITSGNVGDPVQIVLSIPASEDAVFDYQLITLAVSTAGGSVNIIEAKCTAYAAILSQPGAQVGGTLTLSFNLFIPRDTSASPTLPGNSATTATFTFTIEVCDASCTAPTNCAKRKRRSITSGNSTVESVEVATSVVVYPAGTRRRTSSGISSDEVEGEVNVCLSRTPLIGVMVALSVALAVCVGITSWMFCRLKRSSTKDGMSTAGLTNHSYKA